MRHLNLFQAAATGCLTAGFLMGCGSGEMAADPEPQEPTVSRHDDFPNPFTAEAMWGDLPGDRGWGCDQRNVSRR